MMVAGALVTAEAKPKEVSSGARRSAVRKSKDEDVKKLYDKFMLKIKLYKKEKDKDKKAEFKKAATESMNELDDRLAAIDPKYKKLVDAAKAAKNKSKEE